ncbi:MAG: hypothetical protein Q7V88_17585 [Actinomycetota bacterium]|nr:hypothetical protein [Actinomycetota bacterium]
MQRHQYRWWTGRVWGDDVADGGQQGSDPLTPTVAAPASQLPAAFQQPAASPQPVGFQQPVASQQPTYGPVGAYPQMQAGAPPSGATRPATKLAPITLAGAAAAAVGTLLNWIDTGAGSVNGFDVPAVFLADYETQSDNAFSIGLITLALAAMAAVAAFQVSWRPIARTAGAALAGIGAVYLVQLYRLADAAEASVTDLLAIGPFAVIGGGIALLMAAGR